MPTAAAKQRADFTEGSILGSILKMGLPSMFGFLSQNIYGLADTFWVSRLPEQEAAVAAVTFFGNVLWLAFSFNQLIGPGSVAIISRRYGEKAYDLTEKAIKEMLLLKLIFGGVLGLVCFFLVRRMLILLGAEGLALTLGVQYGQIMMLGLAVQFCTYSIYTGMRGVANPQMAMILMLASNALNVILDPIFIFGWLGVPAMGIRGAAIASVLSYALTLAIGLYLFYGRHTNVRLHLIGSQSPSSDSMWKMVKIGIPSWIGDLSFAGSRLLVTPMIAAFGTSVVAAYGVGNQITHFGMMVLVGVGLGLSSLIGHTLGSGKIERARKTASQSVMLGTAFMSAFALGIFVFAGRIVGLFFDDTATIATGVAMLRIFAVGYPCLGAFIIMQNVHTGVGLNTPTMVATLIQAWPLQVLPIFLLTQVFGFTETAVWWSITASMILASLGFWGYYRKGRWLTARV